MQSGNASLASHSYLQLKGELLLVFYSSHFIQAPLSSWAKRQTTRSVVAAAEQLLSDVAAVSCKIIRTYWHLPYLQLQKTIGKGTA